MSIDYDQTDYAVFVRAASAGYEFGLFGTTCTLTYQPIPAAVDQWNRVIIDVDVMSGTVMVTVNGMTKQDNCTGFSGTTGLPTFRIGVNQVAPHGDCNAVIDNVLVVAE